MTTQVRRPSSFLLRVQLLQEVLSELLNKSLQEATVVWIGVEKSDAVNPNCQHWLIIGQYRIIDLLFDKATKQTVTSLICNQVSFFAFMLLCRASSRCALSCFPMSFKSANSFRTLSTASAFLFSASASCLAVVNRPPPFPLPRPPRPPRPLPGVRLFDRAGVRLLDWPGVRLLDWAGWSSSSSSVSFFFLFFPLPSLSFFFFFAAAGGSSWSSSSSSSSVSFFSFFSFCCLWQFPVSLFFSPFSCWHSPCQTRRRRLTSHPTWGHQANPASAQV